MRRKAIKLQPNERSALQELHRISRVPVDQWAQRPEFTARFIRRWNETQGRHDTADDVRHYILTQRKQKKWFKFEGDYDPLRSPGEEDFTTAEWTSLRDAYVELEYGRDQYAGSTELRDSLANEFFERTGRYVTGDRLYAAVMAMQKHKENGWPTLAPQKRKRGRGFGDIDQVA